MYDKTERISHQIFFIKNIIIKKKHMKVHFILLSFLTLFNASCTNKKAENKEQESNITKSAWFFENSVDEFGDEIPGKKILSSLATGTFSNSYTTNSNLSVKIKVYYTYFPGRSDESPYLFMEIILLENGKDKILNSYYPVDITAKIDDKTRHIDYVGEISDLGVSSTMTPKILAKGQIEFRLGFCKELNKNDLVKLLKSGGKYKIRIVNSETKDSYLFLLDTSGFSENFVKLSPQTAYK